MNSSKFFTRILSAVVAVAAPLTFLPADAGIRKIWSVHDGEKISADNLNSPHRISNFIWNGKDIRVFGARNEIIAFQVIVEADGKGIRELSLRLPELRHTAGKGDIVYAPPASDPTLYAGRPIQIFTVNSMYVPAASTAPWVYRRDADAVSKDATGWKPVQLVPENAQQGRGGFPLRVAQGYNQAIWIEIYLDRNLPAGKYVGEIQVDADGKRHRVPVNLEVFDFTLPDENSMHMMVFYSSTQTELYHGRNVDPEYHRLARRHRAELVHAYRRETVEAAIGRFTGDHFTRPRGYEGPGEGVGNKIVPATFYGPGRDFDEKESAWSYADAWIKYLERAVPGAVTFVYMPDEPGPERFARILEIAGNIRSNPGVGRNLPVLVTRNYVEELDGAIDIWCAPCSRDRRYDIERAEQERARGRRYWVYNGGRPEAGAIVIESPATDARMIPWACFKHGVDVYFYWHGVHWRHNTQKQGELIQNVWANPITFDNRGEAKKGPEHEGFINGDGVLMYPGEEKLNPDEDRGVPGPCSTVQLANFRRGLQDHQYLTLARRLGLDDLIDELIQQVVPRVFSDTDNSVGFAERGDAYEAARHRLGRAIEQQMQ